ncbi:DUF4192 domain-containing protein [Actinoplanes sp. TRM 88003]|uniref:DUF4192 domain-containing protein n=1 Tax=Paractinoplanes aksuensis TaxID=2939490 RepID=A0ABT1DZG5_9ACTN|nr:DUF4192 domain-containing protein [Actinoplanes aksuensis]MCO8275305.1 DUF4192 domain-containing protein [Actinoplanes aksuensis]
MNPECTIVVRSPADLIAVTPYLLGFHPADSLVVIGTQGRAVTFVGRHDLPPPGVDDSDAIATMVARQAAQSVSLLGFGPADPVNRLVSSLATALTRVGVQLRDQLRITAGRWWTLDCADPACCPPEGRPVPSPHSPIAATAVFQGQVALPNRQQLVSQVGPVEGDERRRMAAATAALNFRFGDGLPRTMMGRAGRNAVISAEKRHASGRSLTYDETALLGALLVGRTAFDFALNRIGDEPWQLRLWTETTRRVEVPYVPGPAALLGYAAWRVGLGPLARVALDRALNHDPYHHFAMILDRLLAAGISHEAVQDFEPPAGSMRRKAA